MTCQAPSTLAAAGLDHCPSRTPAPGASSAQASLPVFLLTATSAGAFGEGSLPLAPGGMPLLVRANTKSSTTSGDELAAWFGTTFSSFIMSKAQTIFAFPVAASPAVSAQTSSQRLLT